MSTPTTHICQSCGATIAGDLPCMACSLAGVLEIEDQPTDQTPGFSPFELPSSFGHYRVEREIAAGGAGMVYEAVDTVINRPVALKMLRQVLFSTEKERVRFQSEAELVSQMDHPHIIPIYDVGKIEGQPYFTMKLIREGNLAQRLQAGKLPPREAAALMAKIAHAVHHAHQHGILHRDLKPSNILLDGDDQPLLTDFGLAKWLNRDSGLTVTQTISGTPDYMSPEQAAGDKGAISTATDVWALGVMLYQMLTGCLPFRGDNNAEIFRRIAEWEPAPPSSLTQVDQDLETLCLRCLHKNPDRRLSTAHELAQELERWRQGEPIHSRRITRHERLIKWTRRHPYRTTAIVGMSVILIAAATAVTWQWRQAEASAEAERRTAYAAILDQALAARERHDFGQARRLLHSIDPDRRGFDWRLLNSLCQGDELDAFRLGTSRGSEPQCLARIPGTGNIALISANGKLHVRDLRGDEVVPPRGLPSEGTGRYRGLTYSPDGQRIAYARGDVLTVLDAHSLTVLCEETSRLPQFDWLDLNRLLFGFNGSVAAPPYPAPGAWILDFKGIQEAGQEIPRIGISQMCAPLGVSPDRESFVLHRVETNANSWARTLHVFRVGQDLSDLPDPVYSLPGREYPGNLVLSRSGRYLAFSAGVELRRNARVLDLASGEVVFDHAFRFALHGLAIDPEARRLAVGGDDGVVRLYDFTRGVPEGNPLVDTYDDEIERKLREPIDGGGAHNPPGDFITRSARDGRAQFYLGHESRVVDLLFDAENLLVTAGGDGTIRRWPSETPRPAVRLGYQETTYRMSHPAASIDGRKVLYAAGRAVYVCDLDASRKAHQPHTYLLEKHSAPLAVLRDGRPVTQSRVTGHVAIWEETRDVLSEASVPFWHDGKTRGGVLSSDENRLAGMLAGRLFSMDLGRRNMVWGTVLRNSDSAFAGLAISPDGRWIASSAFGPRATVHPFGEPDEIVVTLEGEFRNHDTALVFSRDGRHLYVGNEDGRIRVWDTSTWKELPDLAWPAHRGAVTAIALSHDRTLIATSGDDTLKLFPMDTGPGQQRREHLSFHRPQPANWIQFACDAEGNDRALLHSAPGRTLEIWETD